jgi:retinol dehydrogenase-12
MMEGKTCVVTGGTSGIGKEIAAGLAGMGASVVLVGRSKSKCEEAASEITRRAAGNNASISYLLADLSSQSSIRTMAQAFLDRHQRLDVLVNNAGIFNARHEMTEDGIERTFAVNHLAPFLLTGLLRDRLLASNDARIVTTSSIGHRGVAIDFSDLHFKRRRYSGFEAYRQSKLANILFTRELARRLKDSSATANCFHPGGVRTSLAGGNPWYYQLAWHAAAPFLLSAEKGADTGIYLASSRDLNGVSGKYFVKRRVRVPSPQAQDDDAALRLWKASEELTKLK